MSLTSFKDWAVSQGQVGNPGVNTYIGQCVSLVQQYLSREFGIGYTARGDAKDWATNGNVAQYFDKVSEVHPGDIIVYPGGWHGSSVGHIAIALGNGQMLDQNQVGTKQIKIGALLPGYNAILRRKGTSGGNMEPRMNEGDVDNYYRALLGRPNGGDGFGWVGKTHKEAFYGIKDSDEGRAYRDKVAKALEGSSELPDEYEEVKETLYRRK